MNGTTDIQRVVEIQRMTHAGIQQRCLRRRQADPAQQDAAFGQPAPARDHCEEFVDPGEPLPPSMQPKVSRISRRAIRRRSEANPHSPYGKRVGPEAKRHRRSSSSPTGSDVPILPVVAARAAPWRPRLAIRGSVCARSCDR